jgi:hypothetical protein
MINFLNGLTGIISLLISLVAIIFLVKYIITNGFKMLPIAGIFLLMCILSYLATNPSEIPKLGGEIITIFKEMA